MPASAATNRPEELVGRLSSVDGDACLKALREIKNQIIGNPMRKISYIKLGAISKIARILASDDLDSSLLVQSAIDLGSFSRGVDADVKVVLASGAFPHLIQILSSFKEKVVDAGACSLRMIFQSQLAPKCNFLESQNMDFLILLLNSENDNVTELTASIIAHSCQTEIGPRQKALCSARVLQKLVSLLSGSINQKDTSLDSLAAIFRNNSERVSHFTSLDHGRRALRPILELMKDKYPKIRLLACVCLIVIGQASPCHLQELDIKVEVIPILVELLEEPGRPGDEAPFALANLVTNNEDLPKLAFVANAIVKLCNFLDRSSIQAKRLQGILLALAELSSKLESSRSQFLQLHALSVVVDALSHNCSEVRSVAISVQ